jgi:hypothetical protein
MNRFYCEADYAPDLHRWRTEARIFDLAVHRMINRLPFSIYAVPYPLYRSTANNRAITEVESKH